MSTLDLVLVILGMAVLGLIVSWSFLSGWGLILCLIIGAIALFFAALRSVVKSAIKAALKEYEAEKAETSGQK